MRSEISKKLKYIRRRREMTQAEVAATLNVAQTTYANWETGAALPSLERLCQMCSILDVPLAYFGPCDEGKPQSINQSEYDLILKYRELEEPIKKIVDTIVNIDYKKES